MSRKLKFGEYSYTFSGGDYSGRVNHTLNIPPRKMQLFKDGEEFYLFRQKNVFYNVIMLLPRFLGFDMVPPYYLFHGGKTVGKSKVSFCSPKRRVAVGDDIYKIDLHSNNFISVTKNEQEIAMIEKEKISIAEIHVYHIDIKDEKEAEMIFLLAMVADCRFYPQRGRWSYWKYERTL